MGNVNKVVLIGRLTRDPEVRSFADGGKVANIGFAVNNRRKNEESGAWEDAPVWLELRAFNRERRKLADLAESRLKKGQQVYVEGHLVLDQWEAKDASTPSGTKRMSKMRVHVDELQFLEKREAGSVEATVEDPPF